MTPFPKKQPTHILMTVDAVTGVWQYALELARALRPHEVRITLAVMGPPPTPPQLVEASAVTNLDIVQAPGALEWTPGACSALEAAGNGLLELEQELSPDMVHLNHYAFAALPWGVPVLLTAHSECIGQWMAARPCNRERPLPPELESYRAMVSEALRRADLVVSPTRTLANALCEFYGPLPHMPRIIPHARSPKPPLATQAKRDFVLAAAGRCWLPEKNFKTLDTAIASLAWPVFLAGATESEEGEGIALDHIDCLGTLSGPALGNWMGLASIFVHPCTYEPFGLSVLEAGQAGCALVLADLPSLREIWRDAAIYVNPQQPRAIAAALRRLIEDLPLRTRMGERARRQAMNFAPAVMAESYLEAYGHLLQKSHEPLDLLP